MNSSMPKDIVFLANEWLRLDREDETRAEIEGLVERLNHEKLGELLLQRLEFGTAGLRAPMGAGFSRINSLTIIQTTQGLAEYLSSTETNLETRGVVVGFDGRHNSRHFAELTTAIFVHKKVRVWLCEDNVHTPLIPFAVKHLKAGAGIMITASHNPAQDNGYKVYGSNACQINSPADVKISKSILNNLEPTTWDTEVTKSPSSWVRYIRVTMTSLYMGHLWDLTRAFLPLPQWSLAFVYTPMHGVGAFFMQHAMANLVTHTSQGEHEAFRMIVVEEQAHPNPDFPTVKYPNPEEDGALDLAKATADEHGATIIVANDPDADRLAVAQKVNDTWIQFSGDQLGVLLAYYICQNRDRFVKQSDGKVSARPYLLASAVSSQMISRLAVEADLEFEETLTGFKWLGNRARMLAEEGGQCLFAYEEALGYMIPNFVYDKDGVASAILFLCACAAWGSPWAELQKLYENHGFFVTKNTYWRSSEVQDAVKTFNRIRGLADPYPIEIAGRKVLRWRDLGIGFDSDTEHGRPTLPTSSSNLMITCWLDGSEDLGVRFTIRASGTEPKIKVYLECEANEYDKAAEGATSVLKFIGRQWMNDPSLTMEARLQDIVT